MTIVIPQKEKAMMQTLLDAGHDVKIIGGFVRDSILGLTPHDIDLFTSATGEQILNLFPGSKIMGSEERQKKILTVIVQGVEVSQFRSSGDRKSTGISLKQHCSTCDLTINSIACDIDGNIIDFEGGQSDLQAGIISFVGDAEERINEDPLRVLRAIRFASKYEFAFEAFSAIAIKKNIDLVMSMPKERIRDEFIKIIKTDNGLQALDALEYLTAIIPKLKEVDGLEGGDHHNEFVHEHLNNAFQLCKGITDDWRIWLAALLHDIGKGETYTKEFPEHYVPIEGETPDVHFYRHELAGYKYTEQWMKEYKFAEKDIKFVTTLVKMHMWGYKEGSTKKTFTKNVQILRDAGINIYQFLMLCYCDHQGNAAHDRIKYGDFVAGSYLLENYEAAIVNNTPFKLTDLDIDGRILMSMGFVGPEIGKTLNLLFDMVCEGGIDNKRDQLILETRKLK